MSKKDRKKNKQPEKPVNPTESVESPVLDGNESGDEGNNEPEITEPVIQHTEESTETTETESTETIVGSEPAGERVINTDNLENIHLPDNENAPIETERTAAETTPTDDEILTHAAQTKAVEFSPLGEQRVERGYVDELNQEEQVERVEPEEFKEPTVEFEEDGPEEPAEEPAEKEPKNTAMKEASTEEATQGAEMFADMLIGIYRNLNDGAAWILKVSQFKITNQILDDKIPEDMEIPYGTDGKSVGVPKFWGEFNNAVDEALHIPDNHFDEVRKSMVRSFKKHGIGLSDEQNIAQFFVRDFLKRTTLFGSLLRQQMLNQKMLFKIYEQQKLILAQAGVIK